MNGPVLTLSGATPTTTSTDGKTVTRGPGKLFELGTWSPAPNRPAGFSLSATEADAAIALGLNVPIEVEHVRSVLDGKLGFAKLTGRVGNDLFGVLTIPKALNDLIGPMTPIKVSMVWDPVTKRPLRVGLVLNPAITDAQFAAAFSGSGPTIDTAALYAARNGLCVDPRGAAAERPGIDAAAIYRHRSART